MSYRGTPYYSMARDAGCRHGDEAEQMAAAIETDQRRQAEQQWQREAEERAAHESGGVLADYEMTRDGEPAEPKVLPTGPTEAIGSTGDSDA